MRRSRPHVAVALLAAMTVAACGSGDAPPSQPSPGGSLGGSGVQVTTDQARYQAQDMVGLMIHNQEAVQLAYNACTRELEVREGAAWVAGPASLRLCSREVWYVGPGATGADSTSLDLGLVPGEYRLVIGFSRDEASEGEQIRAVSNSFMIDP